MNLKVKTIYQAWTREIDVWFASPGSVLMKDEINTPYFFETEFKADEQSQNERHPHYGRFLKLIPEKLIMLTWVTGAGGTKGFETVVTVELKTKTDSFRFS